MRDLSPELRAFAARFMLKPEYFADWLEYVSEAARYYRAAGMKEGESIMMAMAERAAVLTELHEGKTERAKMARAELARSVWETIRSEDK